MNSMFSAFDALFAELMVGKNLLASSFNATTTAKPSPTQKRAQKNEKTSDNKIGLVQKTPRFALELDGLHCFETIVRS
ncbi:hypothetical protein Bca4012_065666 [Brassica carinata]|uniref:Avr9/Cf-9 rapidly elicited protein n=1 Tax=Brassica carinata TaxID=52824 RepID=A0A8X8AWY0_BRACI|nr:hypothetical protein Bca52824_017982 [Brassica carinata]